MTRNRLSTRYYSQKQESNVAKLVDGKQTPNSGATPFIKGDVTTKDFIIECKTTMTNKDSYSVKKEVLNKLKSEAFATNKSYYALAFNFGPDSKENFYVIPENVFEEFIHFLSE